MDEKFLAAAMGKLTIAESAALREAYEKQSGGSDYADRIEKAEADIRLLKQRGARGTVGGGEVGTDGEYGQAALAANKSLQTWLTSPVGRKSAISFEVAYKTAKLGGQKAAIMNAGGTVYAPGIRGPQQPALRLGNLLPEVNLSMGSGVEYSKETTFTPGATVQVAQGDRKTETTIAFTPKNAIVQTIATFTKVSVQSLRDVPDIAAWIDQRLSYAVLLKSEDVYLNATDGLLAVASALSAAYTPGTGATGLDFLAGGVSQLMAGGYSPDAIVVSGADAFAMRLLKSTDEAYLWANPGQAIAVQSAWGVPLIVSPSMAAGTFLTAALQQSTILFSRQQLTVEISFENEDDFVRNMATVRAEERNVLTVPVPAGLVKGTFPVPVP